VKSHLAERPTYVIDASVVGRWFVKNPPYLDQTDQLQSDLDDGRVTLVDRLLNLEVTTVETNDLIQPAFDLSLRYGCSYYDAIYLEIARRLDCPYHSC
jgi:predicted nucleic acid-binding protein